MKKVICIDEELFLQMYQFLVLQGLLNGIGETDMYNTFLKKVEELLPEENKLKTTNNERN